MHTIKHERTGPGKFEVSGSVGEYFYDLALEGGADESEAFDNGEGSAYFFDLSDDPVLIVYDDGSYIIQAVILSEDSQGFVMVNTFDTIELGRKAWAEVAASFQESGDDDE